MQCIFRPTNRGLAMHTHHKIAALVTVLSGAFAVL